MLIVLGLVLAEQTRKLKHDEGSLHHGKGRCRIGKRGYVASLLFHHP